MNPYHLLNGVTLAYIGDSYYELYIRKYILDKRYTKVHDLHQLVVNYVSAKAQCKIIETLINSDFLTDDERAIVKRGRNGKVHHMRTNIDIKTYRQSTSFEALIGYLYLMEEVDRLKDVIDKAIAIIERDVI